MKKMACIALCCVFVTATLTGCPPTDPHNGPSEDGPLLPSSSKFIVVGSLYQNHEKSLTSTEIGDLLKGQISKINVWLAEDPTALPADTHSYAEPFVVTVDPDGNYYAEFIVKPAFYNVWVEARDSDTNPDINDGQGKTIFWDSVESFEVISGVNTLLNINLKFMNAYFFEFWIDGLPGTYADSGEALLITAINEQYFTSYNKVGEVLYFSAWLPLSFDGHTSVISITDLGGDTYTSNLNFDLIDAVSGLISTPYSGGSVNIAINFDYENP